MTYTLNLSCPLCPASTKIKVDIPAGWDSRYDGIDDETAFCPKHAPIKDFAESQCPGCVSSWGDCPMWATFAFSRNFMLPSDFDALRSGRCPRRINGTVGVSVGDGVHDLDVRGPPVAAAGSAFADAIIEYIARYHKDGAQ